MDTYKLPDIPYDYGDLEPHISGQIMELHHSKHHATYVEGANRAIDQLAEMRETSDFSSLSTLGRDLAFNLSGHVLHSILWENLRPSDGAERPDGALAERITQDIGGFERFRAHMTEAASTIQGSGWALASWDPAGRRIVIQQIHDHQGEHGQGTIPLLAIDAWEHAYYLQYRNQKAAFFEAIWNVINWDDVAARFDAAHNLALDLGATRQSSR